MSDAERLRLWLTPDPEPDTRRFFLVPEGLEIPQGSAGASLQVRSLQGTIAELDASALAAHEVDAARASAHVDAGWEDVLGRVRDTWRSLLGSDTPDGPPDLGAWLGVTPGEAVTDPDKQRQGRRTLIERVGKLVRADMTDDTVDRMDERLEKLGDALVRDVGRLRTGTENTGETLAELGRGALTRLRTLARKPRGEP